MKPTCNNIDLDNPFAPPDAVIGSGLASEADDFFAVFWRWEKYRLIYNAVLVAETMLALVVRGLFRPPLVFVALFFYAIAANVCFCAGPVLNGYAWRLGYRHRLVGLTILVAGTVLATLIAAVVLSFMGSEWNLGID